MKKNQIISLMAAGLFLFGCSNDTKMREELLNGCSDARVKADAFCKCVQESEKMSSCTDAGKAAQEEIKKLDDLFEKKKKESPYNDAIADSYKEKGDVQRANQACAEKYLEKGGDKWW